MAIRHEGPPQILGDETLRMNLGRYKDTNTRLTGFRFLICSPNPDDRPPFEVFEYNFKKLVVGARIVNGLKVDLPPVQQPVISRRGPKPAEVDKFMDVYRRERPNGTPEGRRVEQLYEYFLSNLEDREPVRMVS